MLKGTGPNPEGIYFLLKNWDFFFFNKEVESWVSVAHAYNPSYLVSFFFFCF
jgi:hypothetical protein